MRLTHITKTFGASVALEEVSLEIRRGEILAVVGENGAGKTTVMRIAAGELRPDSGSVDGDERVELVHQHFMVVPELTIAENLALGDRRRFRFAARRRLLAEARRTIESSGIALADPDRRVRELSVGEKSKLELIKAISRHPQVLILDEPTSVLTPTESEELFGVMRRLAAEGTAVVFISHKLPEVLAIAERIVVMRRGRVVAETTAEATTPRALAAAMVGDSAVRGESSAAGTTSRGEAAPALALRGVSGEMLAGVDLTVAPGEIVAIVGVAGNGQAELASMLRGLSRPRSGTISIAAGRTGHIPEDRTRDGVIAQMTIAENLALPQRHWNAAAAARHAGQMIALYSIRARGPQQRAGDLSGGNQQKVILARELDARPGVIVAAEPSRGLDLESTRFVHEQMRAAAAAGAAVLLITSDLEEAFSLADALHVIYRGTLSRRLSPGEASASVAALMAGVA